jgi:hypothetical protein
VLFYETATTARVNSCCRCRRRRRRRRRRCCRRQVFQQGISAQIDFLLMILHIYKKYNPHSSLLVPSS